jgi:hypothetical protein
MAEEHMRSVRRVIPTVVMLQKQKLCSCIRDSYFKSVKQRRVPNKTEESKYIVTDGYQRLPIVAEKGGCQSYSTHRDVGVFAANSNTISKYTSTGGYQRLPIVTDGTISY